MKKLNLAVFISLLLFCTGCAGQSNISDENDIFFSEEFNAWRKTVVFEENPYGKIIRDITFTGLENVSYKMLRNITNTYKGVVCTDYVLTVLQAKLYALEYFEIIEAYVIRARQQDPNGVIVHFEVIEHPFISEIVLTGNVFFSKDSLLIFLGAAGLNKDSFQSYTSIEFAENAIHKAYEECGFSDIKIETSESLNRNGTYTLTFNINEGYRSIVENIRFEGNTVFSEEELRRCLINQSRGVYNTGLVRDVDFNEDVTALGNYYKDRGYIDISWYNRPDITVTRTQGNTRFLTIVYRITNEGRQYIFGGFNISGNRALSNAELSALVQSKPSEVFNYSIYQNDINRIYDWYFNAGYIAVIIQNDEQKDGRFFSYRLRITEGDLFYVENIIVMGNRRVSTETIRENIPLAPGDVCSRIKIVTGIQNLINMNYFINVIPEVVAGSRDDRVILVITVQEN